MALSLNDTQYNNTLIYAECHFAECRVLINVLLNVKMLSVIMLNVVMLRVVSPDLSAFDFKSECTLIGNCDIHAMRKISFINETKRYEI